MAAKKSREGASHESDGPRVILGQVSKTEDFKALSQKRQNQLWDLLGLRGKCASATFRQLWRQGFPADVDQSPKTRRIRDHLYALRDGVALPLLRASSDTSALKTLIDATFREADTQQAGSSYEIRIKERVPPHRTTIYWVLDDADEAQPINLLQALPYLVAARLVLDDEEMPATAELILLTHRELHESLSNEQWRAPTQEHSEPEYSRVSVVTLSSFVSALLSQRNNKRDDAPPYSLLPIIGIGPDDRPLGDVLSAIKSTLTERSSDSPVALVGGVGCGKTEFMKAIVRDLAKEIPFLPLLFSAEVINTDRELQRPGTVLELEASRCLGLPVSTQTLEWLSRIVKVVVLIDALDESDALRRKDKRVAQAATQSDRGIAIEELVAEIQSVLPLARLVVACRHDFIMDAAGPLPGIEHVFRLTSIAKDAAEPALRQLLSDAGLASLLRGEDAEQFKRLLRRPLFFSFVRGLAEKRTPRVNLPSAALLDELFKEWQFHESVEKDQPTAADDRAFPYTWGHIAACFECELQRPLTSEEIILMVGSYSEMYNLLTPGEISPLPPDQNYVPLVEVPLERNKDGNSCVIGPLLRDHLAANVLAEAMEDLISSNREIVRQDLRSLIPIIFLSRIPLRPSLNPDSSLAPRLIRYISRAGITATKVAGALTKFQTHFAQHEGISYAGTRQATENLLWLAGQLAHSKEDGGQVTVSEVDLAGIDLAEIDFMTGRAVHLVRCNLDGAHLVEPDQTTVFSFQDCLFTSGEKDAKVKATSHFVKAHLANPSGTSGYFELKNDKLKQILDGGLGDFALIPSNELQVCLHEAVRDKDPEPLNSPGFGRRSAPDPNQRKYRAHVPSFLIQRHAVTNLQFAAFLASENGEYFRKEERREKCGNTYYLGAWDQKLDADKEARLLDHIRKRKTGDFLQDQDESTRKWLKSDPVVYVDFDAASTFARWAGLRLPWEVEYEQILQMNALGDGTFFKESEQRALRGRLDELKSSLWPKNWQAYSELRDLQRLVSDERQKAYGFAPPEGLMLGAWEWCFDVWAARYPLETDEQTQIMPTLTYLPPSPASRPATPGWLQHWRESSLKPSNRVLRGSSYLRPEAQRTVTDRWPMPAVNVNHDIGFRCVCPIIPPKSKKES